MEPQQRDGDEDISLRESIYTALNISLIIGKICSIASPGDLLVFRLVNRVFHAHATRQLRVVGHKPIKLWDEDSVNKFLTLMKTRLYPEEIHGLPFTAFHLSLKHSAELLERFVTVTGQHVYRLKVGDSLMDESKQEGGMEQKVVMLLNHTPNMAGIDIFTNTTLYLSNGDIAALPVSFPRLTDIKLDYPSSKYYWSANPAPPDSTSLLSLLINRAPRLEYVHGVRVQDNPEETQGMRALQALSKHQNIRAPLLGNITVYIRPQTLDVLQELKNLNLRLEKLEASVNLDDRDSQTNAIPGPNFILQQLSSWLTILSSNLKDLHLTLQVYHPHEPVTFTIPKLPVTTEFKCALFLYYGVSTRFHVRVAPNTFPALRKLHVTIFPWHLRGDQSRVVTFDWDPLPSVKEFKIDSYSFPIESFSWHRILPNLNSLTLNFPESSSAVSCRANMGYVLRHFPHITSLYIRFYRKFYGSQIDLWDILTAGAVRPASTDALLHGELEHVGEPEEPVEGVFQIPSLGNLRSLTTLSWHRVSRANLNAIVFMTRVGRLGPLNRLHLTTEDNNMKIWKMKTYRDVLAQVHTRVHLSHPPGF